MESAKNTIKQELVKFWKFHNQHSSKEPAKSLKQRVFDVFNRKKQNGTLVVIEPNFNDNCVICQEQLTSSDTQLVVLVCGHVFHLSCYQEWHSTNPICPICRAPIGVGNLIQVHIKTHEPPCETQHRPFVDPMLLNVIQAIE